MKQFNLKSAYTVNQGKHCPVLIPVDLQRIDAHTDASTLKERVAKALGGDTRPQDLNVTYGNTVTVENGKVTRIPSVHVHRKDRSAAAVWQIAA